MLSINRAPFILLFMTPSNSGPPLTVEQGWIYIHYIGVSWPHKNHKIWLYMFIKLVTAPGKNLLINPLISV